MQPRHQQQQQRQQQQQQREQQQQQQPGSTGPAEFSLPPLTVAPFRPGSGGAAHLAGAAARDHVAAMSGAGGEEVQAAVGAIVEQHRRGEISDVGGAWGGMV
jgi:transcription initiation factor TFIID subunit TAF12